MMKIIKQEWEHMGTIKGNDAQMLKIYKKREENGEVKLVGRSHEYITDVYVPGKFLI